MREDFGHGDLEGGGIGEKGEGEEANGSVQGAGLRHWV